MFTDSTTVHLELPYSHIHEKLHAKTANCPYNYYEAVVMDRKKQNVNKTVMSVLALKLQNACLLVNLVTLTLSSLCKLDNVILK